MSNVKEWTSVLPYDSNMVKICVDAKPKIEEILNMKFTTYVPLMYAINPGMPHHYNVKVDVGGRVCFHSVIYAPGGGVKANPEEADHPKDIYDPLF